MESELLVGEVFQLNGEERKKYVFFKFALDEIMVDVESRMTLKQISSGSLDSKTFFDRNFESTCPTLVRFTICKQL